MRVVKYLASGGIGITVNLGTLHILADSFGVYYLTASVIAVSLSTVVGFLLQKYWTFNETTSEHAGTQFALYTGVALANIGANTLIVYIISGVLGFHYLIGQFIGAGMVAVSSFLIYRYVIFSLGVESGRGVA